MGSTPQQSNDQFFVNVYNLFAAQAGGKFSAAVELATVHLISLLAGMYGGDEEKVVAHLFSIADNIKEGTDEGRISFSEMRASRATLQ